MLGLKPILDILLAEDNEDDLFFMQDALKRTPITLHTVRDGEEVMAYLRHEGAYQAAVRPTLLLLDIKMPKKNGFEVLEAIKTDPALQSLPVVVMLTGSSREEDIRRAYANGACSFLVKPTGQDQLKEMMNQFVSYWNNVSRFPAVVRQ